MALRQKIENVPRWPTVASTADLPNVAGSPAQSAYLEVSDECWVTGSGLYVCTAATLGAATWVLIVSTAGAQDKYEAAIIVGNALAGDTAANCTYLDSGNGAGIAAALAAAAALAPLKVKVYLRRGTYTVDPVAVTLPMTIPAGCTLDGDCRTTTTVVTGTGAGGTLQDLFVLMTGAGLHDMTITIPSPVASVAAGNAIVDFRDDADIRRLAINATTSTTTIKSPYIISAYQATASSGCVIDDIVMTYTLALSQSFFCISFDFSNATYAEPAKRNRVQNIQVTNLGANLRGTAVTSTVLAIDIANLTTTRCFGYAYLVPYQSVSGVVQGPTVRDGVCDARGSSTPTNVLPLLFQPAFAAGAGNTIANSVFDSITLRSDANATSGTGQLLLVESGSGQGTFDGLVVADCVGNAPVAAVSNVVLRAQSNITIRNATITGCALGDGDITVTVAGTGVVTDVVVVGNQCRNLVNGGAGVSKSTIVGNRIKGTYTDTGTSTQAGLNNIG